MPGGLIAGAPALGVLVGGALAEGGEDRRLEPDLGRVADAGGRRPGKTGLFDSALVIGRRFEVENRAAEATADGNSRPI